MLPPVFYVQQLEQILFRKLLSPPTPANPARFGPAPRCALMSVFNFFVRFFRAELRPFGLVCLRCAAAVFSCTPRPSFPPHLRLYLYSVFCSLFPCRAASIDLARLRCAAAVFSCTPRPSFPPHLRLYLDSVFCSLFSCRAASIDLARLRCAPDALISIFGFCQPFPFQAAPFGSAFVIFCFLVFPFSFDPYFRRFYDFFLRRKYLESLVRVIRRFGVRPRATKAKKFSGLTFSPAGL